jgi:hypothetical protein
MKSLIAAVSSGWYQTQFDGVVSFASRSGAACSVHGVGRQAQRGGDGRSADPLEGKRSAQMSAMRSTTVRFDIVEGAGIH